MGIESSVVQLARETEQLDERTTGRCDGVARKHRRLRLDVDDQLVEVGTLTGTSRLDAVGDLHDRRVDRVDRDLAGLGVLVAVLTGRNVAATALDRDLELELRVLVERGDDELGVVHLDARGGRDVGSRDLAGTRLAQVRGDGLVTLARDDELLDVQDDLRDVLEDARDRAELVQDAVDADARDGGTGDRRQQAAAQRVADRVAEAGLERFDDEAAPRLGELLLGEGRTLCDEHYVFLSIKCPLYDTCE
jgi:hypothetical protein